MRTGWLDRRYVIGSLAVLAFLLAVSVAANWAAYVVTEKKATAAPATQGEVETLRQQVTVLARRYADMKKISDSQASVASDVRAIKAKVSDLYLQFWVALGGIAVSLLLAGLAFATSRSAKAALKAAPQLPEKPIVAPPPPTPLTPPPPPEPDQSNVFGGTKTMADRKGKAGPTTPSGAEPFTIDDEGASLPLGAKSAAPDPVAPPPPPPVTLTTTISFDQVRELVQNGPNYNASQYRAAAVAIGAPVAIDIVNGELHVVTNDDDGVPRWLMALLDSSGRGILVPSHGYVKDFDIAHHKARAATTISLEPFFRINVTRGGALRYDVACEIERVGDTLSVERPGELSGFND